MVDTENLRGSVNGSQSIAGGGLQAKGDNAYLHIKFSTNEPTCDSDMTDDFSDWIGLYTDNSAEDSTDFTTYKWYKIKGDKGNTGDTGPRGISISSIDKISTSGLIDTYRINFSDSSYFDFQINNGEQNVIEKVYVNGNEISVVNKAINIPIPTEEFIKSKGCIVSPTEPATGEEVWIKKGKNLIDYSKLLWGYKIDDATGIAQYQNTNWLSTEKIQISPNTTYIFSHKLGNNDGGYHYYDKNGNHVGVNAVTGSSITTPANVFYIAVSIWNGSGITTSNETWVQLEQNSTATTHESYIDKEIYCKNDNGVYEKFVNVDNIVNEVDAKAPKSHASSSNTYGIGTANNYGHTKVIDNLTTTSALDGQALNAHQGKVLNDKITAINNALNLFELTSETVSGGVSWSKTLENSTYLIIVSRSNGTTSAGLYIANINTNSALTSIKDYYSDGTLVLNGKTISITPNASTAITILKMPRT